LSLQGGKLEAPSRVLVVEDFEPFRRFICSTLRKRPEFQVVEEATDGLEAVQKAEKLQPDLIILDIGLPSLNGIDAARQIRKLCPKSKLLFMSQESSADVVQEALALGALGYVVKAQAGSELLPAVEAVLQGRQFVSSGLSGHYFTPASTSKTLDRPDVNLPPPAQGSMGDTCCHEVEFYSDHAAFVLGFTRFIEAALEAGNAVIVVATHSHRKSLLQRLQEHSMDIVAAIEQGRCVFVDVADVLSTFMVNDHPDPGRFLQAASNLISAAAKALRGDHRRVAVCGECAPTLWEQGKVDAAIEVERLLDEAVKSRNVDILCGYVLSTFQREQQRHIYDKICAKHSAVSSH
jgi:DNA-binding NarL/FixJ family response regulator